jgi:hypothetical protein
LFRARHLADADPGIEVPVNDLVDAAGPNGASGVADVLVQRTVADENHLTAALVGQLAGQLSTQGLPSHPPKVESARLVGQGPSSRL